MMSASLGYVCPSDRLPLDAVESGLACGRGHRYPVVDGVPVLLRDDVEDTLDVMSASRVAADDYCRGGFEDPYFIDTLSLSKEERDGIRRGLLDEAGIDPVVNYLVAATSGHAYIRAKGRLASVPIPQIRLEDGRGRLLLDLGCSWGRWTIAAAKKGWRVIGIDPSLGAVLAGKRLAVELGLNAEFVVGDARYLPFAGCSADAVYSYSVLQHLSGADLEFVLAEIGRVLVAGGRSEIQMANRYGVRSVQHQLRRRKEPSRFDVRYWSPADLVQRFSKVIGPSRTEAECWFGLGLLESDLDVVSPASRLLIRISLGLRRLAVTFPPIRHTADSVFVVSTKAS